MKNNRLKQMVVILTTFAFLSSTTLAYADMNNYMNNVMSKFGNLSPNVYHMQKRGYFVGGTLKIPPMGETIQPLSITPPNFRNNSCGGIDVTMGGFSFLNFQYLVKKLQGIIQAAPALAFEIAIKVLSEKLGGVMDVLQAVTNSVNGLNFNSCTAMNGIVTKGANVVTSMITNAAKGTTNEQSEGKGDFFGSVISDAYDNIKDTINDYYGSLKKTVEDAEKDSKESHNDSYIGGISTKGLLWQVSDDLNGMPNDFVDMMRYYMGDVYPVKTIGTDGKAGHTLIILQPCGENSNNVSAFATDLAKGEMHKISFNDLQQGKCSGTTDSTTDSLVTQVHNNLNNIIQSLMPGTGVTVSQQTINLISISPIPVYAFMKSAVLADNGQAYAMILSEKLAKPIALAIASEFGSFFIRKVLAASSRINARMSLTAKEHDLKVMHDYRVYLLDLNKQMLNERDNAIKNSQKIYGSFMEEYKNLQITVNQQAKRLQLKEQIKFGRRM